MGRQVRSGGSPHAKKQSGSKDIVLQRQGRTHEKGRKL